MKPGLPNASAALRVALIGLLGLLGSLGLLPSGVAQAQPQPTPGVKRKPPTPPPVSASAGDDNYRATLHLNRAAELFQRGLYDEVAEELQEAYRLNPLPRILCNIAQAYRKGGRQKEAAEQYDLCLRTDPKLTPQERAEFTEYREQALAALALVITPPPHPDPEVTPPPVVSPPPVRTPPTPPPPEKKPIYKRGWFWGVLSGVVVAGAVTTGILVWQLSKPDPVSLLPPGTPVLRF